MEHAKDIELIELAAGRLAEDQRQAVLGHLQGCPRCRDKLAGIQRTWTVLGAWDVPEAASGPLAHIVSLPPRVGTAAFWRVLRFPRFGSVVRVAASIVAAALIGYMGGRHSVGDASDLQPPSLRAYVSVLGLEVGESFSPLVFEEESSGRKDGGV